MLSFIPKYFAFLKASEDRQAGLKQGVFMGVVINNYQHFRVKKSRGRKALKCFITVHLGITVH